MKYLNKILTFVLISVVSLVLIGCSGKPISIPNVEPEVYKQKKNQGHEISASASGFQLLLFIPININDRHDVAYSLLKAKANGGHITDVKIKESWTYAFVGTVYTTTITATVY
jgi:hypothetical protein